jgi:hypothetical protein
MHAAIIIVGRRAGIAIAAIVTGTRIRITISRSTSTTITAGIAGIAITGIGNESGRSKGRPQFFGRGA